MEEVVKKRTNPIQFFREVRQEANKVTWPTRKETLLSTLVVFIMAAVAAVFFLGVDYAISNLVRLILNY